MILNIKASNNGCVVEFNFDDDDLQGREKPEKYLEKMAMEATNLANVMAGGIVDFKKTERDPNALATQSQIYTMNKYGIPHTDQTTQAEASRLITESIDRAKKK